MTFQIGLILPGFKVENYLRTCAVSLHIKQLFQLFQGPNSSQLNSGKICVLYFPLTAVKAKEISLCLQRIEADNRLKTSCHLQSPLHHVAGLCYFLNFKFYQRSFTLTFLLL